MVNIFEQYGIKEVADVTLYAIELDKYDDEIYIPVMYFDTLKVSTIEQTAEQATARGGQGNPELIAWDFGKEITVNLEDALYTPASQSLMWGGKFGIKKTKIYGVWNPYVYPTDRSGRQIYTKRVVMNELEPYDDAHWIINIVINNESYHFIVSLPEGEDDDKTIRIVKSPRPVEKPVNAVGDDYVWFGVSSEGVYTRQYTLIQNNGVYQIEYCDDWEHGYDPGENPERINASDDFDNYFMFICPCDGVAKWSKLESEDGHYKYYHDQTTWEKDQFILTEYNCPSDNIIYESDEISRPVGKYTVVVNNLNNETYWNEIPEKAIITIDAFGNFEYHAYEFVSKTEDEEEICFYKDIDYCDEDTIKCTTEKIDAYGYIWENSDLKMTSLEGNQDIFYLKDTDLRYRIRVDNGLREVSLEYHSENENNYQPKIDVYKNIVYTIINSDGIEESHTQKILAGTFYIIDDWNLSGAAPQEFIYEIESGLQNVNYFERMEKCRAKQTFAIDADKNLRCNNYRYDKAYDTTELAVFINPKTMKPYESNADYYQTKNGAVIEGNLTIIKQNEIYYKWTRNKAPDYTTLGYQIVVDAEHYPGTYKLVGETFARARSDGQDQRYQFEIPLCKLSAETNVTLEAAGDPTTFNMSFRVLRKDDGTMMKLTQYNVSENEAGSTDVIATDVICDEKVFDLSAADKVETKIGKYFLNKTSSTLEIMNPSNETTLFDDVDADAPDQAMIEEISKATDSELETIILNWREPTEASIDDPYTPIYNEEPNDEFENFIGANPSKLVVKETSTYNRSHEEYEVIAGTDTRISDIRIVQDEPVVSTKFLSDSEYNFSVNDNQVTIIPIVEGGE